MSSSHHADLIAERFDVSGFGLARWRTSRHRAALISPAYHSAGRRAAVARPPPRVVTGVVGPVEWIIHERQYYAATVDSNE